MEYNILLDMATDLGYELAMSGAETFRVEESISRVLAAYSVEAEVFAIPNYLVVSIMLEDGTPITRMRRIGNHGNDLDAVEKFSGLSRAYCSRKPDPSEGMRWLDEVRKLRVSYSTPVEYLGNFMGAAGFCLLFGGSWLDSLWAGICGIIVGFISKSLEKLRANPFFRTIATSFVMALLAYSMGALGIAHNTDAVTIGALMILVPGLLFTNAMRDIIYGDINSGINRIVQVLLTAIGIALGTAVAWSLANACFGIPQAAEAIAYSIAAHSLFALVGCVGFAILFNIHGPGGILCAIGGMFSWAVYLIARELGCGDILAYFWSALFASVYSGHSSGIPNKSGSAYCLITGNS